MVSDLVLVGAAAAGSTVLTLLDAGHGWLDWAFGTIVLTGVALVARISWRVHRDARRERDTASRLQALPAAEAARRAVVVERQRLSHDIELCVRESLVRVGHYAAEASAAHDPTAALRRVQAEARSANTELRRQLGLLHSADNEPVQPEGAPAVASQFGLPDYVVAGAVVAVAAVDLMTEHVFEIVDWSWAVLLLTLSSAATVLLRRVAPLVGAWACTALIGVGTIIDAPVTDGFSFPLTVGILAWSVASLRSLHAWLTNGVLVSVALISRLLNQPDNAPINAVLLAVAVLGGATVGHSRAARAAAQESASARGRVLEAAAAEAVQAERRQIARELHDLVSHAVSMIAVQAGAAELSWPGDPATVRRAIDVVQSTAERTVRELDSTLPGGAPTSHDLAELDALCSRMRAAGLPVTLHLEGTLPMEAAATVYRVVQESLTNALRHAPGSRVQIEVVTGPTEVVVRVADDGPGQVDGSRRGYGLVGLAERLRLAGGTLETHSAPEGFTVTAVMPSAPSVARP
jgi:signal transduction histidine kinase